MRVCLFSLLSVTLLTVGCRAPRSSGEDADLLVPVRALERANSRALPDDDSPPAAGYDSGAPLVDSPGWSKERKLVFLNAATSVGILVYGFSQWDYGEKTFRFSSEGWFGANTGSGGADKLGHAYSTYMATLGYSSIYEHWGFPREQADLYGALSGLGLFMLVEVGDALSSFGFALEDMAVNTVGATFGYLRRRYPSLGKLLDFRVEYFPSAATRNGRTDYFTDYSGFKYLLALKLSGFENLAVTPLQYFEIQVGYYTRGYLTADVEFFDGRSRVFYVGIALNLSRILKKLGFGTPSAVAQFYQVPYTSISTRSTRRSPFEAQP